MGTKTGISWTDSTWNPIRGCSRVSEGCRNCYAETIAHRFSGPGLAYEGLVQLDREGKSTGKWNGAIRFVSSHIFDPLRWKEPRRIFVNSMSDLFHENVLEPWIDQIFAVMALCPQHTFQVLTKRPERMLEYMNGHGNSHRRNIPVYNAAVEICAGDFSRMSQQMGRHRSSGEGWWPLRNVHLGVSVEDQKTADLRIPLLLQTPAAVRFISAEPLLGSVDLRSYVGGPWECYQCKCRANVIGRCKGYCQDSTGKSCDATPCPRCGKVHYWGGGTPKGLDWVIVGGESGAGARPMHPDWARSLRDQCKAAGVPFFFKQWGEWASAKGLPGSLRVGHVFDDNFQMIRVGTKATGCLLDGVEHHEFPEVISGTL